MRGMPLGLDASARLAAKLHDFGKYDPAFDSRLLGGKERVDHSTAGAHLLCSRSSAGTRPAAEVLAYAILGHHAGLPDRRGSEASFSRRIETFRDPIAPAITAATTVDFGPVAQELVARIRPGHAPFDLSVATRMVFSCLVDADFRDTEAFYSKIENRDPDRDWPSLAADPGPISSVGCGMGSQRVIRPAPLNSAPRLALLADSGMKSRFTSGSPGRWVWGQPALARPVRRAFLAGATGGARWLTASSKPWRVKASTAANWSSFKRRAASEPR